MIVFDSRFSVFIIFFGFLIIKIDSQFTQADPQWLTSPYFRANNEPVINVLTGSTETPRYTFTFSSALPGLPNLAYGIKGYKGNDYFGQQYFQITRQNLTPSTFSVAIQIFGITNLWILNVAYIAADPAFPHHLNTFDNVPLNYSQGALQNITVMQATQTTYTNVINYTLQAGARSYTTFETPLQGNKVLFFITSLFINSLFRNTTTLYPVDISVSYEILSQSTYYMKASIYQYTSITRLHFSQIVFNYDDVLSSNKYLLIYEIWITDKMGGFKPIEQQFVDNFIMGLKDLATVDGMCGINYRWEFQTVNGQFGVKIYQSDFWHVSTTPDGCSLDSIRNTVFYMKTWQCPQTHIYFNLTSNKCQDVCGNRYYENQTQVICQKCHYSCLKCLKYDENNCTSCESSDYRLITQNYSCQCQQGYYDDGLNSVCQQCPFLSTGCLSCSLNASFNGSGFQFLCIKCNSQLQFFLNQTSNECQKCQLVGCVLCKTLSICQSCDAQYYFLSQPIGQCHLHECGDKVLSGQQQCDDGNTISGDGCSPQCKVQPYWTCLVYYCCSLTTNAISLSLIKYQKILDRNQFKIFIHLSSPLENFETYQQKIEKPKRIQTVPAGGQATYFSYDSYEQVIQIDLAYNQNLGFPFQILIFIQIPVPRSDCQQSLYKATLTIDVDPNNNLPPVFYSQEDYSIRQAISDLLFTMGILSWFLMLWSIFMSRIIGLELMGVFQLAFLDLSNHDHLNLMLTGLLKLDFVNGLNLNTVFRFHQLEQSIPSSIRQIKYSSSFIGNCNLMLFLHLGAMIIGGMIYGLTSYFMVVSNKTNFVKSLIKQMMITFTIFVWLSFSFAMGLKFRYSQNSFSSQQMLDWFLIIIQVLIFLIMLTMIVSGSKHLGQFLDKFKINKPSRIYIAITLLYRLTLGFYLAYNNQSEICTLIILCLVILYLIYHFTHLPFKSSLQNYRSSICHISMASILFITMYYRSMMSSTDLQIKANIFSPAYIQFSALLICILISMIFLGHQTFTKLKLCKMYEVSKTNANEVIIHENTVSNQVLAKMSEKKIYNLNDFVILNDQ